MGKKDGGGGTTTTKTEPWDGQKEYLTTAMQAANSLFQPHITRDEKGDVTGLETVDNALAPAYYSGNTVAPQSAWTKQALQMQAQRALGGSPLVDAASKGITNIVNGGALANNAGLNVLNQMAQADNPYVDELYQLRWTAISTGPGAMAAGSMKRLLRMRRITWLRRCTEASGTSGRRRRRTRQVRITRALVSRSWVRRRRSSLPSSHIRMRLRCRRQAA